MGCTRAKSEKLLPENRPSRDSGKLSRRAFCAVRLCPAWLLFPLIFFLLFVPRNVVTHYHYQVCVMLAEILQRCRKQKKFECEEILLFCENVVSFAIFPHFHVALHFHGCHDKLWIFQRLRLYTFCKPLKMHFLFNDSMMILL